jgi:hypothetical protein
MNAKMKWRVAFETFYLYLLFINKKKVIYWNYKINRVASANFLKH